MDGIRSRPLGPSGLPDELEVDGFPDGLALDGLAPRPGLDVGTGALLPPAVPGDGIEGPDRWVHHDDGLDLADALGSASLWAYGGQPITDPLGPGDGLVLAPVDVAGDLTLDGWDPLHVLARTDDDLFTRPLPGDGLLLVPDLDIATGLGAMDVTFDATNPLDGVELSAGIADDDWLGEPAGALAGLAPPGPLSFVGGDDLDLSALEGPATLFPEMYRADPLDGADPAPGAEPLPVPDPDLDGVTFSALAVPEGESVAPFTRDFVRDDDLVDIAPEDAPFATPAL